MDQPIAVLGIGRMGYPLVLRLADLGYEVIAYNRTKEKCAPLSDHGVRIAADVEEAMRESTVQIMVVSTAEAVKALLDQRGQRTFDSQKTLMVMSTMSSTETLWLSDEAAHVGLNYLEIPVMGGPTEVRDGSMTMMVGAKDSDWEAWQQFLERLTGNLYRVGQVGSASTLKLALNQFMAAEVTALATSVALVRSAGVPVETLMEILSQFPYYANSFDSKLPRMLTDDFADPKFTIDMMGKDVRLMFEEAQARGIYAATLRSILDLYQASSQAGHGEDDYSAIFREIAATS